MPTLQYEVVLPRPLDEVWAFHDDVMTNLPRLSPPEQQVKIESADLPLHEGSKLVVMARGPFGMSMRWVGKIVVYLPPHSVAAGMQARFVDELISGPFAAWQHAHDMEAVDAGTTRLIDRVTYSIPLGPLGWLADGMFVRRQLNAMFRHRHEFMKAWAWENDQQSS